MQVHRFHDLAGLWSGSGETVYLTAKEAEKAAKALRAVARSIRRERFVDSPSLTVQVETHADTFAANKAQGEIKRKA